MAKRSVKNLAIVATIAAAAGFVTGLLTAPKSGKETRDDIKNAAKRGLSEAEHQLKTLSGELGDLVDQAKVKGSDLRGRAGEALSQATSQAQDAREKVREMITAVHDGNADDEDLQLAIRQGNLALQHLRDYLKK